MIKNNIFFLFLIFLAHSTIGQNIGLTPKADIEISENNILISNPWNAGVNAVQFFEIDITLDGVEELVLFDRTSRKIAVYTYKDEKWHYTPALNFNFPSGIRFWIHLQDLDGDLKKDLVLGENDGIYFYKNTSTNSHFSFSSTPELIETTTFSGAPTPLLSSLLDTPAFYDINQDGRLDFFTFVPSVGGSIEYHQNLGVNDNGVPTFRKITSDWGDFHECGDCATYIFGDENCSSNGKIQHLGSAVTIYDIDNDNLGDVLIGEMSCSNLVAIPNKGNSETPLFNESIIDFPPSAPINISMFPAAFFIDLNKNGTKEMIISPNLTSNEGNTTDFSLSTWSYRFNTSNEEWEFDTQGIFQGLDFGERSKPFAFDVDLDGNLDLLVGYRSTFDHQQNMQGGGIAYLRNMGTNENPSFEIIDRDYLNLSSWGMIDITPFMVDYNNNGQIDLLVSARVINSNTAGVYLFEKQDGQYVIHNPTLLIEHRPEESISILDLNEDDLQDIVVGTFSGTLKAFLQVNDNFEETAYFDFIESDLLRKYPSIQIANLDTNAKRDLLVFDDSGTPIVWRDFENPSDRTLQDLITFNNINSRFQNYSFGTKAYATPIGDKLIIGSESGGLQIAELGYYDIPTSITPPQENLDVKIYPNPTYENVTFQNGLESKLEYTIISVQGIQVAHGSILPKTKINLTSLNWAKGIYIIQFKNDEKVLINKKLLVK